MISHLPLQAERIRRRLGSELLAIYEGSAWHPQLLDADPLLKARPGAALSRVLAEHPEVHLLPADPVYYQYCWSQILDRLQRLFPAVEDGGPGCAYLDIAGLESLYGGPAGLDRYLHEAVTGGWRGRWGLGASKFNARCAAVRSRAGKVTRAPSEPAALRAFLARMPATLLPLDDEEQHLLADFGLKTLGDLAAQPRAALRARLREPGGRAWDLSRGDDSEPLRPLPPAETLATQLEFPFPAVSVGAFSVGLLTLLQRLYRHPRLTGRAAGHIALTGQISDQPTWSFAYRFRTPLAGAEAAHETLLAVLSGREPGPLGLPGPVRDLQVELGQLGPAPTIQGELWSKSRKASLRSAVAGLRRRLPGEALLRVVEVEPWSRIPERRQALVRFTAP
jgi:hypothetical protein